MFARAGQAVADAVVDALAVILPVTCSGCGVADRAVCGTCAAAFAGTPIHRRTALGTPILSGTTYEDRVAHVLKAFKDGGRTDAAGVLGAALLRAVQHGFEEYPSEMPVVLVPVPSSREAYRQRGFRPLQTIAARAGLPIVPALTVSRRVADQSRLSSGARARNIAGAYRVTRELSGRRCVLIDDVVTTGASLDEAERAVVAAGAGAHLAVTLASTSRRYAPK